MDRSHARYTKEEIKLILDNWYIQDQAHREAICRQLGRDFDSVNQKFYAILRSLNVKPKDYYKHKGLPPGVTLFDDEDSTEAAQPDTNQVVQSVEPKDEESPRNSFVLSDFRAVSAEKASEPSTPAQKPRANVVDFHPPVFRRPVENGTHVHVIDGTVRKEQATVIDGSDRKDVIDGSVRGETKNAPAILPVEKSITPDQITDLSEIPLLVASHERRLQAIEARITGILTIKEFAAMMRDLEAAYDAQMHLMEELEKERKEKEKLQEQVKRLERRVREREAELAQTIDMINARLLEHFRLNPLEKMSDLPAFEQDMKEMVSIAQRRLGRQVV